MDIFKQDNLINYFKNIKITFVSSYKLCIFLASLLHFMFFILFFLKHLQLLAIFNIFSSIMYLFLYFFVVKKNIVLSTIITFIEVFVHAILCVYFIGWESGFYLYPLCLIPVMYFISINILQKQLYGHIVVIITVMNYYFFKLYSSGRIAEFEYMFMKIDNILYFLNLMSAAFLFAFLICSFLIEMKDIQQDLKIKNHMLENLANIDYLTKLRNRRSMSEELVLAKDKFKNNQDKFCVAIGDVDNFKHINDKYGHDCGDIILKEIANILIKNSDKVDIEPCRWGGEEFLILFKNSNIDSSKQICEKILNDIRDLKVDYNDNIVDPTITFGLAEFNSNNNSIEKLIKKADLNLYEGKRTTKNCIIV